MTVVVPKRFVPRFGLPGPPVELPPQAIARRGLGQLPTTATPETMLDFSSPVSIFGTQFTWTEIAAVAGAGFLLLYLLDIGRGATRRVRSTLRKRSKRQKRIETARKALRTAESK